MIKNILKDIMCNIYKMFIKKIVPIPILNEIADTILFSKEYGLYEKGLINFSSAKIKIEFYDKNKKPLHQCKFVIDDLPVNNNIRLISDSDFTTQDAKEMFNAQIKKILDEMKNKYGLVYYDDTYDIDKHIVHSYIKFDDYYNYY